MQIGKLKKRVNIQERVETRDAIGGNVKTWTTIATRWASIVPMTGRELVEAEKVASQATVKITFRQFPGLTESHRLVFATNN